MIPPHQEATALLMSGPRCSPGGLPVRGRSGAWPDARTVPAVPRCSPSVQQAEPRRGRYREAFRQRGGQEVGDEGRGADNEAGRAQVGVPSKKIQPGSNSSRS